MKVIGLAFLLMLQVGCQSLIIKRYDSGLVYSQYSSQKVVLYSSYDDREVIESKTVFQSYYENGQKKCETVVDDRSGVEPEFCHFEWYESGVIKKDSKIDFLLPRPISEIIYSEAGGKIEETEFDSGHARVIKKYGAVGDMIEKKEFVYGKLSKHEEYSANNVRVLLVKYHFGSTSAPKLRKEWFDSGRIKLERYYNLIGQPEKEFAWDESGNSLPTWYTKQQEEIKIAQKKRENAKKREEKHRRELYMIDHDWSISSVETKYRKAGGYCTSNETSFRYGSSHVQLVCNINARTHRYYYFDNGEMTAIQN